MDQLVRLYQYAEDHDIEVDYFLLGRAASLSIPLGDGTYAVALDPTKMESTARETVELAHELGHCATGAFYDPNSPQMLVGKCEYKADKWAIKKLLPEEELKAAMRDGYTEPWQLAEYFDVTEDVVRKAAVLYQF